jgi:hypothetical protein
MRPRLAAPLAALALAAGTALAFIPPTPVQNLLYAASGPSDLRARLVAHADSASADALDAGEAWYYVGVSWARAGQPDSALAAFRRAQALRANPEDAIATADLLLATGSRDDADSAKAMLAPVESEFAVRGGPFAEELRLRTAWVRAMQGDANALRSAIAPRTGALFRPRTEIPNRALWAGRFATLALSLGNDDAAWRLIAPVVVTTRGLDPFTSRLAREASAGRPFEGSFDRWLAAACARADSVETAALRPLRVRPLVVRAEDGTALRAWLVPGPAGAAIAVVTAPVDPEAAVACDSLVTQLRRARLAVALLEPRGVRGSASQKDPSPVHWLGHEEAAQRRLARDLGAALAAAARAAGTPAARGLAVGVGPAAMSAVLAAESDPRFRAVLLAGPEIAAVDRGWLRASLARSGAPVFFETGPEGMRDNEAVDRIVAALPPRQVRVADARAPGGGAALFRAGAAEGARVAAWLKDALSPPRATPPARPR